jgi:hypothetical protein
VLKNWKALLGGGEASSSASGDSSSQPARSSGSILNGRRHPEAVQRRHSAGLDQFFFSIRDQEGLSILDLAGASQANITFITNMGHRLYSDDIMRTLEAAFGSGGDFFENQSDPERVKQFMSSALDFPEEEFGGALVWDTLQFLAPSLLHDTVDQIYHILQPGASMLAFFHADEKAKAAPIYSYRIGDSKTLLLSSRGERRPAQFFNNRALEKLFARFSSVKFFLTRDSLREVIVKR